MRKNVLVTGGAGFIGSHLVDRLIADDYHVIVVDNLSLGKKENLNPKADFWFEDIRDLNALKGIFQHMHKEWGPVDYVFHCAAMPRIQPSIKNPDASFTNNLLGTHNVLVAAKEAGVKKFIYSGSSSVYGDQNIFPVVEGAPTGPKNPYALHKKMGEELCLQFLELYQLPVVCLRYFNVYGERQPTEGSYATVIGIFLKQMKDGQPLTIVGNGEQRRDFTYVGDVVQANISAMNASKAVGEVINVGSGKDYSINEIASWFKWPSVKIPPRPGEAHKTLAWISHARDFLGYQPTVSLPDWLKSQLEKMPDMV